MSAGGGLDAAACTEDVTFEDPAARCCGRDEVQEAFRALRICRPEHLIAPDAVAGEKPGSTRVQLHQRYFGRLALHSELLVHTAPDGRICAFEERWNGVELLKAAPFRWARRWNGIASAALTPLFVAS